MVERCKAIGYATHKQLELVITTKTGIAEYDMDWEDLKTHLSYVRYVKLAGGEPNYYGWNIYPTIRRTG